MERSHSLRSHRQAEAKEHSLSGGIHPWFLPLKVQTSNWGSYNREGASPWQATCTSCETLGHFPQISVPW